MALYKSHLVDDLVQDDSIETGFTWPFLNFCCAVLRLKHPTKVGPEMTIRCYKNHPRPTLKKEYYQVDYCEFDKSQKIFLRLEHPT